MIPRSLFPQFSIVTIEAKALSQHAFSSRPVQSIFQRDDARDVYVDHSAQRTTAHLLSRGFKPQEGLYREMSCGGLWC